MKALPMIFNTEMVQALMDGKKVQTRRPFSMPQGWDLKDGNLCKITGKHPKSGKWGVMIRRELYDGRYEHDLVVAPAMPGDLIYVRETFCKVDDTEHGEDVWVDYRATPKYSSEHPAGWDCDPDNPYALKWKPSIHMPRELSRITLKVTSVRVERVQDISLNDCIAEGFRGGHGSIPGYMYSATPKEHFSETWKQIYGDHWDNNGWVWVIDFEVIQANVDAVIEKMGVA
jgi:hypothetical protein